MNRTREIRKCLQKMEDDEVRMLCFDYFQNVYNHFDKTTTSSDAIDVLLRFTSNDELAKALKSEGFSEPIGENLVITSVSVTIAIIVGVLLLSLAYFYFKSNELSNTPTPSVIYEGTSTDTPVTNTQESTVIPTTTTLKGKLVFPLTYGLGEARLYITGFDGMGLRGRSPNMIPSAGQPSWTYDGNYIFAHAIFEGVEGVYKINGINYNSVLIIENDKARWPVSSSDNEDVVYVNGKLGNRLTRWQNGGVTEIQGQNGPIRGEYLVWSDNNILIYRSCQQEQECGIWMVNPDRPSPELLLPDAESYPMDANQEWLVYQSKTDGAWDVYLLSLINRNELSRNLTNNPADDGLPTIAPDGNMVAYISNESGSWAVWTIDFANNSKQLQFEIPMDLGLVDVKSWVNERMDWTR